MVLRKRLKYEMKERKRREKGSKIKKNAANFGTELCHWTWKFRNLSKCQAKTMTNLGKGIKAIKSEIYAKYQSSKLNPITDPSGAACYCSSFSAVIVHIVSCESLYSWCCASNSDFASILKLGGEAFHSWLNQEGKGKSRRKSGKQSRSEQDSWKVIVTNFSNLSMSRKLK